MNSAGFGVAVDGYCWAMTINEPPPTVDDTTERQELLELRRKQVEEQRTTRLWHQRLLSGSTVVAAHAPGWEQRHWTSRALHRVGDTAGHSAAGIVATILVLVWAGVGLASGFPSWWQTALYSVTGSVTFIMVFVIQHTQQRQTSGTQRKLDELIRSSDPADNALIAVEEAPDEDLQALTNLNLADRTRAADTGGE